MVARNFSVQELPYSRLLQMPDDEREFLTLDELKPHQLTELGVEPHASSSNNAQNLLPLDNSSQQQVVQQQGQTNADMQQNSQQQPYGHTIYYDLNSQTTGNGYCNNSIYMDGNSMQSTMIDHPTAILQQTDSSGIVSTANKQTYHSSSHNSNHHHSSSHCESSKKRKYSYTDCSDDQDDDGCNDTKSVKTTDENKKQNHSEIEKRRRDKMNTYISELSAMIPMCHAMSRKLDKLTVLRMTVQHLKQISGAVQSYTEGHYKPSFLTEQEMKMLILQAAEGFLFVVGCDRGRILYVSESVAQVLNYSQGDLLGQSWFDILHPKDVSKVKEQLSSSDLSPREKLIDAKTMLPVKTDVPHGGSRLCPGARRSFFCRMKCKGGTGNGSIQIKEEVDSSSTNQTSSSCPRRKSKVSSDKKYVVVQCTGYLKSWAPAKIGLEEHQETSECDADSYNLSCLVALGRIQPNIYQQNLNAQCPNLSLRNIQFISRHAMDGKFLFVDQRATPVLGFLPQELLGTSMYEYYHHNDIPVLAESHKAALQGNEQVTTPIYQVKAKDGSYVRIQSQWKSFRNPWTKEIEYLIAKNNIILSDIGEMETNYQQEQQKPNQSQQQQQGQNACQNFEFFSQNPARDMQRMINTHIEASKIGRQIADQVLDYQRRLGDSSSDSSPDPERTLAQMVPVRDPTLASSSLGLDQQLTPLLPAKQINGTLPSYNSMHVAPMLNPDHANDPEVSELMDASVGNAAVTPNSGGPTEGNDEAAMAVIMSLLEADAGLGGPVDFSGLPWPLP